MADRLAGNPRDVRPPEGRLETGLNTKRRREERSAGLLSTPKRRGHFRAPGPGMTESQSTFRSKGPPSGACPQPPAPSRPRRTPPHPLALQARRWLAERCPCLQHLSHPGWLLALSPSVHGVTPVVLG